MILFILIIAAIAFIYFNVIPKKGHTFIAWIALIATFLSVCGIVAHDSMHYGMKVETSIEKKELYSSVSPKFPVLMYQPLGNGTEKIYLYKTSNYQKKPLHTSTDQTTAEVKTAKSPYVKISTERYIYSNNLSQFMFGIFGHNNEFKSRKYTFYVPKNWKTLSVKQMKALQKKMARQMMQKKMMQQKMKNKGLN